MRTRNFIFNIEIFFFYCLLNERLYKKHDKISLLNRLNILFDNLNQIINDNYENDQLLQNKIYDQLFFYIYIFKINKNDFEPKDCMKNKTLLYAVQKNIHYY